METFAPNDKASMKTSRPMEAAGIPPAGTPPTQASMETFHYCNSKGLVEASTPDAEVLTQNVIPALIMAAPNNIPAAAISRLQRQDGEGCCNAGQQKTFYKRRQRLLKKACELSVLCDAEVGAIIFSPSGKISEYASSSMSQIVQRYQSFQPQMPSNDVLLQGVETWTRKADLLNDRIKCLEAFQRSLFEKNKVTSFIKEAQGIELILEHTLNKIRIRKTQLTDMEIHKTIDKDKILCKENNMLQKKLTQIVLMKECANNSSTKMKELCGPQGYVNTKLQLGLDILQGTQDDEDSYSSNK